MSAKMKILIVDDDEKTAELVKILLTRVGCEVQLAPNGKLGLELAFAHKFDLIILDVDLPDANGFEICRELKKQHLFSRVPVIFASGRSIEENFEKGRQAGGVDYIMKPFGANDFVRRVLAHVKTNPEDIHTAKASP